MTTAKAEPQTADARFLRRILFLLVAATLLTMGLGITLTAMSVNAQAPVSGYEVTQ